MPTPPPIACASSRTIDSPSPVPPKRRVVELSAWVKGWNSRACCSGETPMPLSVTENSSSAPSASRPISRTSMRTLPCGVNLIALLTRFDSICRSR